MHLWTSVNRKNRLVKSVYKGTDASYSVSVLPAAQPEIMQAARSSAMSDRPTAASIRILVYARVLHLPHR